MRMWVFLGFMLTAAIQDFRKKEVDLWVFVLFGAAAFLLNVYLWITAETKFLWQEHLLSCGLGAGLLLTGKLSQDGIGAGDGLFFLTSGLMLRFWENLTILCSGIFLGGMYGLAVFGWNQIYGKKNVRKMTIPFLPFVAIPGIWMAVLNCKGA